MHQIQLELCLKTNQTGREKQRKVLCKSCIYFLLPVSWGGTLTTFAQEAGAQSSVCSSSCDRGRRWPRRGWRARSPSRRSGCRRSSRLCPCSLLRKKEPRKLNTRLAEMKPFCFDLRHCFFWSDSHKSRRLWVQQLCRQLVVFMLRQVIAPDISRSLGR